MKRKVLATALVLGLSVSLAACGGAKESAPKDTENKTATTQTAPAKAEQKMLEGTLTDKKDTMFVVKDAAGKEYQLAFNNGKAVDGYDKLATGDKVSVTYTGELSDVDAFEGEVISIVKK